MTLERWEEIKAKIKADFEVLLEAKETNDDPPEESENIEFLTAGKKFKLSFIKKPKVLERKTQYSNRIGGEVNVNFIYSADEFTYSLNAYNWNEALDDWQQMESSNFA